MNSASPFAMLGVREPLVRALTQAGITEPFPIQADTLPASLAGRDVLGRGRTGSGKTLAFAIPLIERLADGPARHTAPHRPVGLVLAPTRELATQIAAAIEPLAAACGMTVTTIFGGVSQHRQERTLRRGVDIVVACPGRLEDLMGQRLVTLDAIAVTVIDEADHMADLGFLPGVTRILAATPAGGQRLLFSATLDNGVNKLVNRFLPNATLHSVDEANSPVAAMTHHIFEASDVTAKRALVHTLASGTGRRILFTRTKHQARKLAKQLTVAGIPAVDLHGNLSQGARDRNLAAFAAGEAKVLVATDVAARGVHVDGVELVVHVDPPAEHKAYLHRSGRTARAGSAGDVVTLVLPTERRDLMALMRKAKIDVTPQKAPADSFAVAQLVGDVAPLRHVSEEPRQTASAERRGRRSAAAPTGQSRGAERSRTGGAKPARAGGGSATGGSAKRTHTGATKRANTDQTKSASRGGTHRTGRSTAPSGSTGGVVGFSKSGGRGRR